MGILERFEDSLDRMVSGAFARAFKAEVQPVEIASAVQREMDDRAAVIDRERTVVPNIFHIGCAVVGAMTLTMVLQYLLGLRLDCMRFLFWLLLWWLLLLLWWLWLPCCCRCACCCCCRCHR